MVLRPRQHSMGYIWQTGFTGQKTQPTYQSIEGKATKENQKKEKKHKIHIHILYIQNSRE